MSRGPCDSQPMLSVPRDCGLVALSCWVGFWSILHGHSPGLVRLTSMRRLLRKSFSADEASPMQLLLGISFTPSVK